MRTHARFAIAVLVAASWLVTIAPEAHAATTAIISNGTVQMGINDVGDLNVGGGTLSGQGSTTRVGLRLVANNDEFTADGCPCEGWGVADPATSVAGYADESTGRSGNLAVQSFTTSATAATSVVNVGTTFQVTHDYQPSTQTPNLYVVTVSIKNLTASTINAVLYRRLMDWDIEPTAFSEFVTLQKGSASAITFTSDNGFATANPLVAGGSLSFTGNATDSGPSDHGALFDFNFGSLAAGATKTFKTFYGAAPDEATANGALAAVGAEAFSFGQPNTTDGPSLGKPNTAIFAFAGVGGAPLFGGCAPGDQEIKGNQGGSLYLSGGSWCIHDANVQGSVYAKNGASLRVFKSTINGGLSATGGSVLTVCESKVVSSLTASNATDFVQVGNPNNGCKGNTLSSVTMSNNTKSLALAGNTSSGSFTVNNNTGAAAALIGGNKIGGSLSCSGNSPQPVNGGQPNQTTGSKSGQCASL